ncbi:f-box domain protein [Apiospora arundinis]
MESNSYPYTPLSSDEIRYLSVRALDQSVGVVQCDLHQASIKEVEGRLTALSYVWGDASATQTIQLRGHPFEVTTNLEASLRQFATNPKQQQSCLWVDAICINQDDVEERNIQVRRMKDIYSLAESVIAWLGPATHHSHIAMHWLQNISPSEIEDMVKQEDKNRMIEAWAYICQDDAVETLPDVVQRPYWHRTWILQEIILGRKVRLLCGDDEVALEKLSAVCSLMKQYLIHVMSGGERDRFPELYGLMMEFFKSGVSTILGFNHTGPRNIAYLVNKFNGYRCSDLRDKVYGLLGICNRSEADIIIPDYNRPVAKVYADTVEAHIRSFGDLEIMAYVLFNEKRDPCHPSWVPDWQLFINRPARLGNGSGDFAASNNLHLSSHPWSLDRKAERLDLTGACLDTIITLGTTLKLDYTSAVSDKIVDAATDIMRLVYHGLTHDPSEDGFTSKFLQGVDVPTYALNDNEPLDHACRRTLLAGRDGSGDEEGCAAQSPFMMVLPGEEGRQNADGSLYTHDDMFMTCAVSLNYKRLAITSKGWIGLVPEATEIGDHVAVLIGASTPFILRKAPARGMPDVGGRKARQDSKNRR